MERAYQPQACCPGLAYAALNLRRNPFGELDLSQRAELAVVELEPYVRRLAEPGFALQLMGDKGRGKTTHLLAIGRRFRQAPYFRVPEVGAVAIPEAPVILADEIQRLGRRQRCRLFHPGRSLALGTHEDFAGELRRAGFVVETVAVAASLDAARLAEIVNRRIEAARRGPGPVPEVSLDVARELLSQFGDDVRRIEWHLYDWIQRSA